MVDDGGQLCDIDVARNRKSSHRNVYIENTVLCAVNGIAGLEQFKSEDTFRKLAETKKRVHVRLRGDNDFYSQVQRVSKSRGWEVVVNTLTMRVVMLD